jgi:hypothetical protein
MNDIQYVYKYIQNYIYRMIMVVKTEAYSEQQRIKENYKIAA